MVNIYLNNTGEQVHFVGFLGMIINDMFKYENSKNMEVDVIIEAPHSDIILYGELRIDGIHIDGEVMDPEYVYGRIKSFVGVNPGMEEYVMPSENIKELGMVG